MRRDQIEERLENAGKPVDEPIVQIWKHRFAVVASLLLGFHSGNPIHADDPYRGKSP